MFGEWTDALDSERTQTYFLELEDFVARERREHIVYPREEHVYRALHATPLHKVRVVLLGQDPYHGAGQAHGLSFSVQPSVAIPPSLRNIFLERHNDLGIEPSAHGCLEHWASQGVLLLNTTLTVRAQEAGSHRGRGWETFTDAVIDAVINDVGVGRRHVVFILWGEHARKKAARLAGTNHTVIESAHPSPLSARHGFFGSKPFSRANAALASHGIPIIDWSLPPVATLSTD